MLGKRSPQRELFDADNIYLDFVGRDTFYGFLALNRGKLFSDEQFASLYCVDNGRNPALAGFLRRFWRWRCTCNRTIKSPMRRRWLGRSLTCDGR